MQPPPDLGDTAERDYFTSERGWSLCKQRKEPVYINEQWDRVAHITTYAIIA